MKKIWMGTALLLILSVAATGQFNTGASYFAGSTHGKIGFESTSTEFGSNENWLCLGFTPEAGYFIRNRLAVGGAILIDYQRLLGDFGYGEYDIIFGPSVRYYLPRDTEMQVFLSAFAGYGFKPSHQVIKIMIGPGINFFLTERVAFETRLLYSLAREWNAEGGGHHNVHDVTVMAGITLFFSDLTFITRKGDLVE